MKECNKCLGEQELDKFSWVNKERGYKHSTCKKCMNKAKHIKRMLNPELEKLRSRRSKMKCYYNITMDDYNNMYIKQDGKCKICNDYYTQLNVDHCHDTQVVRGLLCGDCNKGLGQFRDNSLRLESASKYLKETNTDKLKIITI